MRLSRLLTLSIVGLAVTTSASFAFWTGSGSGTASGSVATLASPAITNVVAGAGSATISWSGVSAPSTPAVRYYVTRDGGPAAAACGLQASPISATSCTDTGLTAGERYTYRVVAVWRSWSATSAPVQSDAIGAAVHHLAVSSPGPQTAGAAFSVTVTAKSEGGATVEDFDGPRTVAWSGPQAAPDGTPPLYPSTATALTFTDGVATATAIKLHRAAASTTLTATAGSVSGTSAAFAVAAAGPAAFSIADPGPQTAGVAFDLTVTARDAYGNAAAYSGARALTWSGAASSPKGDAPVLPATVTFADGTGTASGLKLHRAVATTLTATEGSLTGSTPSFTVAPAAASRFSVATPGAQVAGAAFGLSLTALDAFDNPATGYTGARTVAFSGPASAPDGTAPSYPASVTFTAGAATASPIRLYGAATSTTLTATEGAISGTSGGFTVAPAAASQLQVANPGTQTAGSPFSLAITAQDAYRNTATGYAGSRDLTFSGPATGPDGTAATYPASVTFAAGTATASAITLRRATAPATTALTVAAGSISGTSPAFQVNAGAPARYAWGTITAGTPAPGSSPPSCLFTCTWSSFGIGAKFSATITVTDANGNVVSNLGTARTVTMGADSGAFSPTTVSVPAAGRAESAGTTYTARTNNGWTTAALTATGPVHTAASMTVNK